MQEIEVRSYHEFFQKTLQVQELFDRLRDGRKRPQIPAGVIAQAIVYALSAGQKSLLGIDHLLKTSHLGRVLQVDRFPLCSDTTMSEVLETVPPEQVREILYQVAEVLIRLGLRQGDLDPRPKAREHC